MTQEKNTPSTELKPWEQEVKVSRKGALFNLRYGIEVDGKEYHSVWLRHPKGRDVDQMGDRDGVGSGMALVLANCASIPDGPTTVPEVSFLNMLGFDYMHVVKKFNEHFLGLKPENVKKQ